MRRFFRHFRKYVLRGLLALIPLGISFFVLKVLYVAIDKKVLDLIDQLIGFRVPGLGLILLLILLYVVGYLTSNILGRRLLHFIERIIERIPIVKTTYQIGKQLSSTLSLPEKQVFKRAVLVDYFRPGVWTIGFVTGSLLDRKNNEKLLKVFIPTVPNPTSGILVILKESQTFNPGWSVEQAMKVVISGGIIGPDEILGNIENKR